MSPQKLHFLDSDMLFWISTKFGWVMMLLTSLTEVLFVSLFMFSIQKLMGDDATTKCHIFWLQTSFFVVLFANSVLDLPKVHTYAFVQNGDLFPLRYLWKYTVRRGMVTHLGDNDWIWVSTTIPVAFQQGNRLYSLLQRAYTFVSSSPSHAVASCTSTCTQQILLQY